METIWYGYQLAIGITAWLGSIIIALVCAFVLARIIAGIAGIIARAILRRKSDR